MEDSKVLFGLLAVAGLGLGIFFLAKRTKWKVGDSAYYYKEDWGWITFTITDIAKFNGAVTYLIRDGLGKVYWISAREFDKKLFSEAPVA